MRESHTVAMTCDLLRSNFSDYIILLPPSCNIVYSGFQNLSSNIKTSRGQT